MIANDYVLELNSVFYSGQVEPASCAQRLLGSVKTGVILKDVSMTVYSGEVIAILGSKGSGKKALLDVIARRVQGPTRGQILLNNQPLSLNVFNQRCGYVTHKCDLIPGLTVEENLYYVPTKLSGYVKKSKVKQVMADLALSQIAGRCTENLNRSEFRRLMIGMQFVKDPVVLLLDEPTWDLDPLNTYLVISILSNAAKKYGSAIILTMEKPRSDVFPFLERVLYLCLGDVVYSGGTRQMLEYFNEIGFPCPQLENPLMYYLCLSTVDRRSRERFVESNHQIAALVEKFKLEGGIYRKGTMNHPMEHSLGLGNKMPLLLEKPGTFRVGWTLYTRILASTLSLRKCGMKSMFLRLFLLPLFFFMLWGIYREMKNYQHTFVTRNGLILNILCGSYFIGIINAISLFSVYRTRYFQESQEGLYGGTLFLTTYNLVTIPFSFLTTAMATAIIYPLIGSFDEPMEYLYLTLILWACYLFSEQQTMAILIMVKDRLTAAIFSTYITCICIAVGSGILRSMKGLQDWLYYLTYGIQARYASSFLHRQIFLTPEMQRALSFDDSKNCSGMNLIETSSLLSNNPYCRYASGQAYLTERYSRDATDVIFNGVLDFDINLGVTFAFAVGMLVFNLFLYILPLPAFIKAKFRE
ncbi:ATP-binding cassette sub-family G member 5 [Harmonia axyridis]|uniref:ATP-binding cassette sub-family G member 5 n=1 Tax=Harmonia axyridis TaxID=115357 RepID=UPI001E278DA2|nr:ATP-binding cassette sub-family G member 5 [Harmonia axyridis]